MRRAASTHSAKPLEGLSLIFWGVLAVRFGGCWVGDLYLWCPLHYFCLAGAHERIAIEIEIIAAAMQSSSSARERARDHSASSPHLPAALYTSYATSPKHTPRSAPPPRRFIKTQMGPGHIPRLCSFVPTPTPMMRLYFLSSSHSHRSRTCTAYPTYSHVRPRVAMCKQRTLRTCSLCPLLVLARTCPRQPLPHVLFVAACLCGWGI